MDDALKFAELVSYLITIAGVPAGIYVYLKAKQKEARDRGLEIYIKSNESYVRYLETVLSHADLGCGDFQKDDPHIVQSGLTLEQVAIYQMLFMAMEQAHYLYANAECTNSKAWRVWEEYITWRIKTPDFRKAFEVIGPFLEDDFYAFVRSVMEKSPTSR